jgi:hypothetical protein
MKVEWQYSRSWRKHWLDPDGSLYGERMNFLWEIYPCVEYGLIHDKKDGYDLLHKGKKVKHGKTVKELKKYVKGVTPSSI